MGRVSVFENINFTAIQLQPTPKPACIFKFTEHVVEEESPNDFNHKLSDDEDLLLVESISRALVCGNHLVRVTMKDNAMLPYVASMWNVL